MDLEIIKTLLEDLKADVKRIQEQVGEIKTILAASEARLSQTEQRVEKVENIQLELRDRIQALDTKVQKLESVPKIMGAAGATILFILSILKYLKLI